MKHLLKTLFVFFSLLCAGSLHAETPNEAAKEIHSLIQNEKYEELFTTRYSEWYKVEKEGVAKEVAVERLSRTYKKNRKMILSLYEQIQSAEFTISDRDHPQESETGKVASAQIMHNAKEVPFKLYQMKNGKWGFHL